MSNTTATGGVLTQLLTPENIQHDLHDIIAGILNLQNTLVRPKNQDNPPPPPPFGMDWVAFGTSNIIADGFAYIDTNSVQRQEHLVVTASVYGTNSESNARALREGLELSQNWEHYNIRFVGSDNIMRIPELHNGRWLQRYDLTFKISQSARNQYGILSLSTSGQVIIKSN